MKKMSKYVATGLLGMTLLGSLAGCEERLNLTQTLLPAKVATMKRSRSMSIMG